MHKWIMDHVYYCRMEWNLTEKFNNLGQWGGGLEAGNFGRFLGTENAMLFKQV